MPKSFLYKIFHFSLMNEELKQRLVNDGLTCLEENIPYSITYRNYKSPGHRFGYKKRSGRASIGYSRNFFVASTQFNKFIDIPIKHEKFKLLNFLVESGKLLIKYDAHSFIENRSGEIELIFNIKDPSLFMRFI